MLLKFLTMNGIKVVDGAQTVNMETYELATATLSRQPACGPNKRCDHSECLQIGAVDYGFITGAIQLGNLDPKGRVL